MRTGREGCVHHSSNTVGQCPPPIVYSKNINVRKITFVVRVTHADMILRDSISLSAKKKV